jgi:hypothetical protein
MSGRLERDHSKTTQDVVKSCRTCYCRCRHMLVLLHVLPVVDTRCWWNWCSVCCVLHPPHNSASYQPCSC